MTTNSQLSAAESKKQKLSKQLEQEQNHRTFGGYSAGWGKGDNGGKSAGIKKHNW